MALIQDLVEGTRDVRAEREMNSGSNFCANVPSRALTPIFHCFSVPNHGPLWKSLMRAHLGDYEAEEARLNRIGHKKGFEQA